MNVERELKSRKDGNTDKAANDKDGVFRKAFEKAEKILVKGVLPVSIIAAGVGLGRCGSAADSPNLDADSDVASEEVEEIREDGPGRLDNIEREIRDESEVVDVSGEEISDVVEDVPVEEMIDVVELDEEVAEVIEEVTEDVQEEASEDVQGEDVEEVTDVEEEVVDVIVEDVGEEDAQEEATDVVEEVTDVVEEVTEDVQEEDVEEDAPADAVPDVEEDAVEDVGEDVTTDAEADASPDAVDDTVEDATVDSTDAVTEDGTSVVDVESEDYFGEDVSGDVTLYCSPYEAEETVWIETDKTAEVGNVHFKYNGIDGVTGKASYDVICGGVTVKEDIQVAEGEYRVVDILGQNLRVAIRADVVETNGTTSKISVYPLEVHEPGEDAGGDPTSCVAFDAFTYRFIYIGDEYKMTVGGVEITYKGLDGDENTKFDISCNGTVVRENVVIPQLTDVIIEVDEHKFDIMIRTAVADDHRTYVYVDVDAHD